MVRPVMPSAARPELVTLPSLMIWSAMLRTVEAGMAKPMPGAAPSPICGSVAASVGMPMTWSERLTRAPPLLPGLMAAEVCTTLARVAPVPPPLLGSLTVRPVAETMPWVTLPDSPSGLPMASTICPISTLAESPKVAGFRSPGALSILMTARSCSG
ncbi:hypothetical protein SRIMM317S_02202 [Streptomyces rimosus subsp. rimosus]